MEKLQVQNALYPLVCICSSIILLVVGLMYAKNPLFPVYILVVCLLYCIFGFAKTTLKCILIFTIVGSVFGFFSFLVSRNISAAVQMGERVLLIGVSSVPMVTLPPIRLTRCLTQLGFPRIVALGMLIAIRFVPIIGLEVRRVRQAMETRGAKASFYRAFVVPVMVRLISMSDTLALSLETRAFDLDQKEATVYEPVHFTLKDGLYMASVGILLVGMAVLG